MSETFRNIRTNLQFMLQNDKKVILVTSTVSGEGKSFISANLAISLSLLGKKVVIVGPVSYTHLNHKDPDSGSWDGITTASQITNPLAWMEVQDHDATSHISTHARLTFNLMDELKLVLFGAYTYNIVENSQYLTTSCLLYTSID